MTANKMIPTNGKRPEGLKDEIITMVWVQWKPLDGCPREIECIGATPVTPWKNIEAYCVIPEPAPYVPEPDYSKWIGKVCKFWGMDENYSLYEVLTDYSPNDLLPFINACGHYLHCRPVTADEIVKE